MPSSAQKHTSYADVKSILDGCLLPTAHTPYSCCHLAPNVLPCMERQPPMDFLEMSQRPPMGYGGNYV